MTDELSVSTVAGGLLVTTYALGISIGGPVLTATTLRISRSLLLELSMLAYVAGNLLALVAVDLGMLLAARVATGALHGLFIGAAFAVAAASVPPRQMGRAIAVVLAGISVATAFGVPLGTRLGQAVGWRASFSAIVIAGVVTLALMLRLVVQQPLHRLQKLPGATTSTPFLYDDTWMHDQVSRRTVRQHDAAITLYPGVAYGLARLSGLLKPTLEILWVEDARRMNRFLDEQVPDVAGHLFGRERIDLGPARSALREAFGPTCFYCGTSVPPNGPVDHVLPWSRLGIDGLATLVLACSRCNTSKLHSLPALQHVDRALEREQSTLEEMAASLLWPTQYARVVSAARGLYRGEPTGTPTGQGVRSTVVLDLAAYSPWWIEYGGRHHVSG